MAVEMLARLASEGGSKHKMFLTFVDSLLTGIFFSEMVRRRFIAITTTPSGAGASVGAIPSRTDGTMQAEAGGTSEPKKIRGPTKMNDFWKLKASEKAPIDLNEYRAPVGHLGGSYCNFLGTIARRSIYCPLIYERWHDLPKQLKNEIWDDVVLPRCEFLRIPGDYAQIKEWTLHDIGEKWRNWKNYIKSTHFDFTKEEEDNVRDSEEWLKERGVCLDQYRSLARFWLSEKGRKLVRGERKIGVRAKYLMLLAPNLFV